MIKVLGGLTGIAMLGGLGTALAPAGTYEVLDARGEPFSSAFNRDAGKVRVVMLVAPT
jgi:hypothetical protein